MNLLFPVSVTVSTAVCVLLGAGAATAETDFERTSFMFLTAIMALAIIEHWFLILPLPFEALWNWSLGSRNRAAEPPAKAARIAPARIKQPRPAA
jgi:putative photosynthetic complex assembly protein 2